MEYDDLYDESPYISKGISKRGGAMGAIRTIFVIFAIMLTSILGLNFYGYWQDQFIISASNDYIAIFDKKTKTMNICDRVNCNLITPRFPEAEPFPLPTGQQESWISRLFNFQQWGKPDKEQTGQRLLGSFSQPQQMPVNPQMMQQMNPQMMPQMNPQMMQQMNPQMMPQINPQMMQQMNPQMMGQPQQMANRMPQAKEETESDTGTDSTAPDEGEEEAAPV